MVDAWFVAADCGQTTQLQANTSAIDVVQCSGRLGCTDINIEGRVVGSHPAATHTRSMFHGPRRKLFNDFVIIWFLDVEHI